MSPWIILGWPLMFVGASACAASFFMVSGLALNFVMTERVSRQAMALSAVLVCTGPAAVALGVWLSR